MMTELLVWFELILFCVLVPLLAIGTMVAIIWIKYQIINPPMLTMPRLPRLRLPRPALQFSLGLPNGNHSNGHAHDFSLRVHPQYVRCINCPEYVRSLVKTNAIEGQYFLPGMPAETKKAKQVKQVKQQPNKDKQNSKQQKQHKQQGKQSKQSGSKSKYQFVGQIYSISDSGITLSNMRLSLANGDTVRHGKQEHILDADYPQSDDAHILLPQSMTSNMAVGQALMLKP